MIYRGPAFLMGVRFVFSATPFPPPPPRLPSGVSQFQSSCVSPVEFTDGRWGERGSARSQIIRPRESCSPLSIIQYSLDASYNSALPVRSHTLIYKKKLVKKSLDIPFTFQILYVKITSWQNVWEHKFADGLWLQYCITHYIFWRRP